MKNLILTLVVGMLLCGCTTLQPTATVSARVQAIAAQEPGDIALVLTPVLLKNPKYAPDAALLGKTLPALLLNGPITPSSYTAAAATIPNLTADERTQLAYAGLVLNAGLQLYEGISGQTIVFYTDPNVKAIVDGFCAGLVAAAANVPAS
jgi:hypothetical protein